ncbi:hydrogenase maturation nickel metallochaperone HypA [Acetomicrobium sp.]|jgi:hydrogenase nickel incorporation protein HypA/HybF|uniref:hydrogenase maturation nickel metallochaperone HypA n=1 Tax=Acetomicrobium sp. TaxID=1872099 RepID=UPI002B260E1B|nr:hydrogenase maturation nickel metallochaperone HypA [Acetomicrobium sp.]
MHEMSIVEALMEQITEMAQEQNWEAVTRVRLKVGVMRQIVPDILEFCFNVASKGTIMEGAILEMEEIPLRVKCEGCGHIWSDREFLGLCPECGSIDVNVLGGMELELTNLEVEVKHAKAREH